MTTRSRASVGGAALALAVLACRAPAAPAPARLAPSREEATAASSQHLSLSVAGGCWLRDGKVWCWNGALDQPASPAPRAVPLPAAALDVAGSLHLGCAVLATGTLHCWGDNTWGQLGAASPAPSSETPLAVRGIDTAVAVAVAADHVCAALQDGSVVCWGNNRYGQCGHDLEYAPAVRQLVLPERVDGVRGARRVVVSRTSSCAFGDGGTWCWGAMLGIHDSGTPTDRTRATAIAPLARVKDVALGSDCGCALTAENRVACFALTQYGCPSADVRAGVEPLFGWSDVRALAVGDAGACAERGDRGVVCWSHPARDPSLAGSFVPVARVLEASAGVPVVADGPCVLGAGRLECWGGGYWNESVDSAGGAERRAQRPQRILLP
ncbi:MAG TPA: hypothetical protein VMG12_27375 [Polyangiaceae bacterium]|nr:hypothetical protein [Polyangiaceae bacterium]